MRLVTPEALAAVFASLPGCPRIVASGNHAAPYEALEIADKAIAEWRLFMLNAPAGIPTRDGIRLETPFVGAGMRGRPNLDYVPARLSLVPVLFRDTARPDVVLIHTSPPADGTVSLGCEVNVLPAAIECARARGALVIAQVNRRMPYTYGDGQLPVEEIDFAIEVDRPLDSPASRPPDDTRREIGERVAALVPEAATLQLGIGAIPDATLAALHGRRRLRLWSEMFSDGVLALERVGAFDPDERLYASFCFGSPALYEWLDRNPRVRMLRTERTNDPGLIARQRRMTSINSALQVDLFAQANAHRRRGEIYSGFGGQTDFIVGALHAPAGQAVIALPSWHAKANASTFVPMLEGPVTSFQHSHIVTEHGVARIFGCGQRDQAHQLVERCAHPDARDELRLAAVELGLA